MMKRLIAIVTVFAAHVAVFVAAYYGRFHGIQMLETDTILIGVPFGFATAGYASVAVAWIRPLNTMWRVGVVVIASLGAALVSGIVGLAVAFNLMGI